MAGLFLLFLIVIGLVFLKQRWPAMILFLITLALCVALYFYHATDTLKICL